RGMNILTPLVIGDQVFTSSYGGGSAMVTISQADGKFNVAEAWRKTAEAYMSSPVLVDGRIYLHLRNQRFTCIDPVKGETLWTSTPYGKYWSTAMNGDRLLVLDERGDLMLIQADPKEFQLKSTRHVSDSSTWAHIAVADQEVFVRDLNGLTVYRWGR
ncbi:MAG: PQQ-binding-like beta-propeller repeat protein, partial [Planctomyces sp.]